MSDPRPNRLLRFARRAALAMALLVVLFAVLFVSFEPAVATRARPSAHDIAAAREVWRQLKTAKGAAAAKRIRADNESIRGIVALASDATGYARFDAGITRGVLAGQASLALPAGLWINASASVTGDHAGFPDYHLTIGRVPFPGVASRWMANLGRLVLRLKGADVPPLDSIVRHVTVDRQEVVADLVLPADSGVVDGIISAGGEPLNEPLVSDIYCRIAAAQRKAPVATLAELVRRTFDPAHVDGGEEFSRAALVALSFVVVGEQAEALAPRAAELSKNCPHPHGGYLLQQRADLAKHWTFSAGLTAVLGGETAASLGEWKELDDSLPNGSGFSFVDLSADRSGMKAALRVLDPDQAAGATAEFARVTDEDLLPGALLQNAEGISEASFIDSFGSLDRTRYRQAVTAIDRVLAQQRSARPRGS